MAKKHQHIIAVETESEELNLSINDPASRWWFKVFHAWVESGWWAVMTPAAAKVLIVLAKHANGEGRAWPSAERIMYLSGLERSSVFAAINQLEAFTLIRKVQRGYGQKRYTVWEITVPTKLPAKFRARGPSDNKVLEIGQVAPLSDLADKVRESPKHRPIAPPTKSGGLDSCLLDRSRSVPEQRIRTTDAARAEEQEPRNPLDAMTDEELEEAKAMAIAVAQEALKPFLVKADPRKNPILRARMLLLMEAR